MADWAAYQQQVLQMRQSPYLDYPSHVHLETLSLCTAACEFCPYPSLERQGNRMSDDLLDKILKDLGDIPKHIPFQISPFKVNEPFLDKRLLPLLKRINLELPQASISLTTNASPLIPKILASLGEIRQIAYLWISVNDYRPDEYTRIMALPWQRTFDRLTYLHNQKFQGKVPFKVVLSRVGDGTVEDTRFCEWVAKTFPLFQYSVFQRGGWIGQVNLGQLGPVPQVGCVRWFDLSITSTGEVAHCCMDGQAQWPIGNANHEHLLDIYNSPDYRKLREKTLSRTEVSPCNTCTFL